MTGRQFEILSNWILARGGTAAITELLQMLNDNVPYKRIAERFDIDPGQFSRTVTALTRHVYTLHPDLADTFQTWLHAEHARAATVIEFANNPPRPIPLPGRRGLIPITVPPPEIMRIPAEPKALPPAKRKRVKRSLRPEG